MSCNRFPATVPGRRGQVMLSLGLVFVLTASASVFAQDEASFRPLAEGVLARSLSLDQPEGSALEIEVLHMLVAPGRVGTGALVLPGGAVLELLSGRGAIVAGDRVRDVGPGAVVAVNAGTTVRFDNRQGEAPLEWRVTLVRPRSP